MSFFSKTQQKETMEAVNKTRAFNQESVFRAVEQIKYPCNGLAIARHLNFDSARVTPRLSDLVKKGRLLVKYRKRGLDGKWRNFYVVNPDYRVSS
jgi:hypothetical protein